ncbi:MAG TPA: hypothetical protein ENG16_00920 [Archaeoglobus sp.]|nr:hypothetical protein [Archaeoglobus sp.]
MEELEFVSWLICISQDVAREDYKHFDSCYSADCLEDLFLHRFVDVTVRSLERHGFKVLRRYTERDDYGDEYTVIELEKYVIHIRNTLMCGVEEGFEFIVSPK